MTDRLRAQQTTRRDLIKLAGAAALGAAGMAALRTTEVRAAGSGDTLVFYFNPQFLTKGTLGPGAEVVIGPFPTPGQPFHSYDYLGIVGNLTASKWTSAGWLSIRPNGMAFDPLHQAQNLHFSGQLVAWSNWFICQFGPPSVTGKQSDGKFIIHNGGTSSVNFRVDLHGFLGPDQ